MNNIRMLHAAHDLDFAPNAHQICVRRDLALFDRLDGHLLAGLLVDAQLHLAVRALAQFLDDVKALAQLLAVVVHAQRPGVADARHDVVNGGRMRQRRRPRRRRLLLLGAGHAVVVVVVVVSQTGGSCAANHHGEAAAKTDRD